MMGGWYHVDRWLLGYAWWLIQCCYDDGWCLLQPTPLIMPGQHAQALCYTVGLLQLASFSHATKHSISPEESFHSASELRISLTKRNGVLKIDSLYKRRIIQRNSGEGDSWPLERAVHPQHWVKCPPESPTCALRRWKKNPSLPLLSAIAAFTLHQILSYLRE